MYICFFPLYLVLVTFLAQAQTGNLLLIPYPRSPGWTTTQVISHGPALTPSSAGSRASRSLIHGSGPSTPSNKEQPSSTRVELTPTGSDTLDGISGAYVINKTYEGVQVWSDGIEWFIIQKKA